MLSQEQVSAYHRDGFLKVSGLFSDNEITELESEMRWIVDEWWGEDSIGWRGPWRDHYLPSGEQENTKAVFISNPQYYSAVWGRIVFHPMLIKALQSLIGENIVWHHTILHGKPPEKGTPFPMHQDYPFYPHDGPNFIDCLLHLDHTPIDSGCLQAVPGSHKAGPLEHITGEHTRPYLCPDKYHPDLLLSKSIPATAGDIIFFSYYTIHWSDVNRTNQWRKSVRIGFHTPEMRPIGIGQQVANNRLMVAGIKSHDQEPKLTYR